MNTIQFKYAIEVERTGSISQAAENLYMAQPNLSKAIANWRDSLGFAVFERTSRGVVPTRKGEEFLKLARSVLLQIGQMEALKDDHPDHVQRFSLSMPRGSYIADGVSRFISALDPHGDMRLSIKENQLRADGQQRAFRALPSGHHPLSRPARVALSGFSQRKGTDVEQLWEYDYEVLLSRQHPLAAMDPLDPARLEDYIELTHGDKPCRIFPRCRARPIARGIAKTAAFSFTSAPAQFEFSAACPAPICGPRRSRAMCSSRGACCKSRAPRTVAIAIFSSTRAAYTLNEYDRLFIDKLFDARNDIAFGDRRDLR